MHTLKYARSFKFMDCFFHNSSVFACKYQFSLSRSWYFHFNRFIYITISMSCYSDRFLPGTDIRLNALYNNWSTEYRSVQQCTDGAVRTFPHLFQMIFFHTGSVWCDGCTFYCDTVFLCCHCTVCCYLVISSISVFQSKIIILCLQINKWQQ